MIVAGFDLRQNAVPADVLYRGSRQLEEFGRNILFGPSRMLCEKACEAALKAQGGGGQMGRAGMIAGYNQGGVCCER